MGSARSHRHDSRRRHTAALVALVLFAPSSLLYSHGGEDHGEAAAATPAAVAGMQGDVLTSSSSTDYFEVVAKYPVTDAGEDTRIRLFVSDFATNRAIAGAALALAFKPAGVVVRAAPTMVSPGIYDVVVRFPDDGTYSVVATVTAGRRTDFVEIRNLFAGDAARTFLAEHGSGAAIAATESRGSWLPIAAVVGGVVLAGAIVFVVVRKRRVGRHAVGQSVARDPDLSTEPGRADTADSSESDTASTP